MRINTFVFSRVHLSVQIFFGGSLKAGHVPGFVLYLTLQDSSTIRACPLRLYRTYNIF